MDKGQSKPKLSRAILDMKFMKKTKERVEKEQEDAEGQAMYSNDITEQMRRGGKYAVVEVSVNFCKDLIEGRLSFGGMNPEIERIMEPAIHVIALQQSEDETVSSNTLSPAPYYFTEHSGRPSSC
ncbi:M-phase phosphoprotein 6 [Carabus blaptoides fortunei]